MDGSIYDPMERLDEIRAWMLKHLSELKKVLTHRLEKIQAEWKVTPPFDETPAQCHIPGTVSPPIEQTITHPEPLHGHRSSSR